MWVLVRDIMVPGEEVWEGMKSKVFSIIQTKFGIDPEVEEGYNKFAQDTYYHSVI